MTECMVDNSGSFSSSSNIANVFDANRAPINHAAAGRSIFCLRDSLVFYEAKHCDIKGKTYPSAQAKHCVCDSGMFHVVLRTRSMD